MKYIILLFLSSCGLSVKCQYKTIAEIGGCNRYSCGVKYTDGTFGSEDGPVVGQSKNVCKLGKN